MTKQQNYAELARTLASLLADERDWIANLANTAALVTTVADSGPCSPPRHLKDLECAFIKSKRQLAFRYPLVGSVV